MRLFLKRRNIPDHQMECLDRSIDRAKLTSLLRFYSIDIERQIGMRHDGVDESRRNTYYIFAPKTGINSLEIPGFIVETILRFFLIRVLYDRPHLDRRKSETFGHNVLRE